MSKNQPSDLTTYLSKVSSNLKGPYPRCIAIADDVLSARANALDQNKHVTAAQLFQISFSSWRAAATLSLAGASSQVPALLRHSLEAALYSFVCANDKEFEDIWWKREFDDNAKSLMRKKGKNPKDRFNQLTGETNPNLQSKVSDTLNTLVDFGAHPNMMIMLDHIDLDEEARTARYTTRLLGTEEARNSAFFHSCGVAVDLAALYREIWPLRFTSNLERQVQELIGQTNLFLNAHHNRNYESNQQPRN